MLRQRQQMQGWSKVGFDIGLDPQFFRLQFIVLDTSQTRAHGDCVEAIAELGSHAIGSPPSISPRRIVLSSIIRTAVEGYDFFIYATVTALVFNKLFFPASVASLSSIAAFATYGVGFFARPVGAGNGQRGIDLTGCHVL
jgi:hypothetical protein